MQVLLQQSTLLCLFIFGCAGSSLLLRLLSTFSVQASHCSGFFCCGAQALGLRASEVVAYGLGCSVACRIFLAQGSNPCLLHWQVDFSPEPPGKHGVYKGISLHSSFPCSSHECIIIILVWIRKASDILIFYFSWKNCYTFPCDDLLFQQGFCVSLHILCHVFLAMSHITNHLLISASA